MAAPWVGLTECAEHSLAGTDFLAFDQVSGGRMGTAGGGIEYEVGTGGQASKWRGPLHGAGNVSCLLQSIGLLADLKPAALGSLPPIIEKIRGGPIVDTSAAWLHEDCRLTKVALGCDQGKALTVGYEWIALLPSRVTIAAIDVVAKQTQRVFPWHAQSITFATAIAAAAYKCIGWNAEFTTGITPQSSSDAKAVTVPTSARIAEWIDPGTFEGKITARMRVPLAYTNDFMADFVDVVKFKVIALNNDVAVKTFTLDMTASGAANMDDGMPTEIAKGPDAVIYELSASILPNDLAAVVISLVSA
jgi:hypothetical protein